MAGLPETDPLRRLIGACRQFLRGVAINVVSHPGGSGSRREGMQSVVQEGIALLRVSAGLPAHAGTLGFQPRYQRGREACLPTLITKRHGRGRAVGSMQADQQPFPGHQELQVIGSFFTPKTIGL
jgi:hypothetical protein